MSNQELLLRTPATQRAQGQVEKSIREMDLERRQRREGIKRQRIELEMIIDDNDEKENAIINNYYDRSSSFPLETSWMDTSFQSAETASSPSLPSADDDTPPACALRPRTLNSLFDNCIGRPRSISFDEEDLPFMPSL